MLIGAFSNTQLYFNKGVRLKDLKGFIGHMAVPLRVEGACENKKYQKGNLCFPNLRCLEVLDWQRRERNARSAART
jgi:hypothetical protein